MNKVYGYLVGVRVEDGVQIDPHMIQEILQSHLRSDDVVDVDVEGMGEIDCYEPIDLGPEDYKIELVDQTKQSVQPSGSKLDI